jgi:hypothetical protein
VGWYLRLAATPVAQFTVAEVTPNKTALNQYFKQENDGLSELIGKDLARYWYKD